MTQHLFLCSAIGISGVGESVRRHLGHNRKLKTAFVTTPIEVEDMSDDSWYQDDRKALTRNDFEIFDYTITGKKSTSFTRDLGSVDAIYVSGGNTNHLLQQSHKSNFASFIRDFVDSGKIYVSTSAGSIITGPQLPPYLWGDETDVPDLTNYTCWNLVNFTLIPHWGSEIFRDKYLSERMSQIYTDSVQPFVLCNDHEYVEVIGDKYRIVDVRSEK
jgi:dipeptidase E